MPEWPYAIAVVGHPWTSTIGLRLDRPRPHRQLSKRGFRCTSLFACPDRGFEIPHRTEMSRRAQKKRSAASRNRSMALRSTDHRAKCNQLTCMLWMTRQAAAVDGGHHRCDRSRDKSAPTISTCLIRSRLEVSSDDPSRNITAMSRLRAGTVIRNGFNLLLP